MSTFESKVTSHNMIELMEFSCMNYFGCHMSQLAVGSYTGISLANLRGWGEVVTGAAPGPIFLIYFHAVWGKIWLNNSSPPWELSPPPNRLGNLGSATVYILPLTHHSKWTAHESTPCNTQRTLDQIPAKQQNNLQWVLHFTIKYNISVTDQLSSNENRYLKEISATLQWNPYFAINSVKQPPLFCDP